MFLVFILVLLYYFFNYLLFLFIPEILKLLYHCFVLIAQLKIKNFGIIFQIYIFKNIKYRLFKLLLLLLINYFWYIYIKIKISRLYIYNKYL